MYCVYIAQCGVGRSKGTRRFECVECGVRLGVVKGLSWMTKAKYGNGMRTQRVV